MRSTASGKRWWPTQTWAIFSIIQGERFWKKVKKFWTSNPHTSLWILFFFLSDYIYIYFPQAIQVHSFHIQNSDWAIIFTLPQFHFSLYYVPRGQRIITIRDVIIAFWVLFFFRLERGGMVSPLASPPEFFNKKLQSIPIPFPTLRSTYSTSSFWSKTTPITKAELFLTIQRQDQDSMG